MRFDIRLSQKSFVHALFYLGCSSLVGYLEYKTSRIMNVGEIHKTERVGEEDTGTARRETFYAT